MPSKSIRIKITAPIALGVIHLLKSLALRPHTSTIVGDVFRESRPDNAQDQKFIDKYVELMDTVDEQSLEKLAAQSKSLNNFLANAEAILKPVDYIRLQSIFLHFAPLYRQIIRTKRTDKWLKEELFMFGVLAQRLKFKRKLKMLMKLFNSNWPYELPFTVAVIPIPNRTGGTNGSSQLLVEFLELKEDYWLTSSMDVIFHEMCHSYFRFKSKEIADMLFESFMESNGNVPFFLLNEGLATAVSQGWFEKERTGKLPKDQRWYGNEYIDGYAKALYPLLLPFIKQEKQLDATLAKRAVKAFEKRFPGKLTNPRLLLWNTLVIENKSGLFSKQFETLVPWGNYRVTASLNSEAGPRLFEDLQVLTGAIAVTPSELKDVQQNYLPDTDLNDLIESSKNIGDDGIFWFKRINRRWVFIFVGETVDQQVNALKRLLELDSL